MISKLLDGVDKTLVRNLVILHTLVIAVSNYLVTIRFELFPGADLPLFGSFPLAAAAFTFPIVVVATELTVRLGIGLRLAPDPTMTSSLPVTWQPVLLLATA